MTAARDPARDLQPRPDRTRPDQGGAAAPQLQFKWAKPFASGHSRAIWTMALLALTAAAEFASAALNGRKYEPATASHGGILDSGAGLHDWATELVVVASIIAFSIWTHRVYRNLPALGARDLRYSPGWAVGWLFIPLANLVLPYFVFAEIWRHSIPTPAGDSKERRARRTSLLLVGWWIANVLPFVMLLGGVALAVYWYLRIALATNASDDPGQIERSVHAMESTLWQLNGIVLPLLGAAAAILAIFVVRRIDKNQQARHALAGHQATQLRAGEIAPAEPPRPL